MKLVAAAIGLQACLTVSLLTAQQQQAPQHTQPQTQQPQAQQPKAPEQQLGSKPATATLTFSGQAVGSTSASQSVTLTNSGGAALSITSIAVTGTNSGDFTQTNTCGDTVSAGVGLHQLGGFHANQPLRKQCPRRGELQHFRGIQTDCIRQPDCHSQHHRQCGRLTSCSGSHGNQR